MCNGEKINANDENFLLRFVYVIMLVKITKTKISKKEEKGMK